MSSFADTIKQLGPSRLGIIGAMVIGLMFFFIFISMRVSTPDMKLLYRDLSTVDASAIAAKLEENQIPYEISADGERVVVSEEEVGRARMLLAEAGLPNGGSMGYEIFDNQSTFGTTNFVQNINQIRALEGELARTISSLKNIRSARVHLVLPQRELFSRAEKNASASVFLGVRPGAQLENQQILAIRSLVSSAVGDLKASNVSIIDHNGNLLAKGGEEQNSMLSVKAEELRRSFESRLTSKIEDQVARIVGFGNVRATVTAQMNFDRISTNEELFDPETQVVRSSQVTEENNTEREAAGNGEVSVESNLPGAGGDLLINGNDDPSQESNRIEEVTNYEISKTIRSTVREVGEINSLSVAVLVDGQYIENAEGERQYQPRTPEELEQITALVKSATGFSEERGDTIEVVNMKFAKVDIEEEIIEDDKIMGFEKDKLLDVAEFLIVGIMIILVTLLVLQPMVNRIIEAEARPIDEDLEADLLAAPPTNAALAPPDADEESAEAMIDLQGVEGKVKATAVNKVAEIIENHPNETVAVLRSWMSNE